MTGLISGAHLLYTPPSMPPLADTTTSVSFLDCAGKQACQIVSIYSIVFWIAMFVLVVVGGLIIYAALRFRRRDDGEPAQVHGNGRLEVAWTVMPSLILVVIFYLTFTNMDFVRNGPSTDITVKVTGQQYAWTFQYPNGKQAGFQLVIPTGKTVQLLVTSKDVLHSFWVPRVGGQIYAIPGQMNHGWIEADQPGLYLGECNELCGFGHFSMQIQVLAEAPSQFIAWYTGKATNGGGTVATAVTGAAAAASVSETDQLRFQPSSTTIKAGDVVQWTNTGTTVHNVTFDNSQVPHSDTMSGGNKYEIKFSQPGTYHYVCTFHVTAGMQGTIVVTGAAVSAAATVSGIPAAGNVSATDQLQFQPSSLTVKAGDVVQWTNSGQSVHNVTFDNSQVPSSNTLSGATKYEVKFNQPGTYHYVCTFHVTAGMRGTITVTP